MNKEEKFEILREVTRLSPVSKLRIYREFKKAERLRDLCEKNDPTHVYSADYTAAYELEYDIRMRSLQEDMKWAWKQYTKMEHDGICLAEFADNFLEMYSYRKEKERTLKKV